MGKAMTEEHKELLQVARRLKNQERREWRDNAIMLGEEWRIRRSDELNWVVEQLSESGRWGHRGFYPSLVDCIRPAAKQMSDRAYASALAAGAPPERLLDWLLVIEERLHDRLVKMVD